MVGNPFLTGLWKGSPSSDQKRCFESGGEPVQIATENLDLSSELKRGLSYVRKRGDKRKDAA